VRVAAIQLNSSAARDANLQVADRLVREAVSQGARLVVLPEKWNALAEAPVAEPPDGPALSWARATARELGIDLVAGSVTLEGGPLPANACVHVGPDGEDRAIYRKIHMFDSRVGGREYRESAHEAPGDEVVVSSLADGTGLGLAVCYDLRFPELFRALTRGGAEVVALPSAFTETTTRAHWDVLVRARAIEQQCCVVAANQTGEHAPGMRSGGRSMIVDAWGTVLAAAPEEGEAVVVADLDLDRLREIRRDVPVLEHVRPEAYGAGSMV
jgi:deaminated glutathione amidase